MCSTGWICQQSWTVAKWVARIAKAPAVRDRTPYDQIGPVPAAGVQDWDKSRRGTYGSIASGCKLVQDSRRTGGSLDLDRLWREFAKI